MNQFDYARMEESRIVDELETYRTFESVVIAEDNLIENRVRQQYKRFLKDGGFIQ